jgi:KDO2-lipid IV(A) lauroyltransferase
MIAMATGAPILPVTIQRLKGGRHRVTAEPAWEPRPEGDRTEEAVRVTRELNHWLEEKIRARPGHWLWIHRRWKKKPP